MPRQYIRAHGGDRLWPQVDIGERCWLWTGTLDRDGYGKLRDFEQRSRRAHAYAWWLATGEWPTPGEVVGHTCDVLYPVGSHAYRACVRNDDEGIYSVDGTEYRRVGHLWLGTSIANTRDRVLKGRSAMGDRSGARIRPESLPRGEQHGRATLTAISVMSMRSEYDSGTPRAVLAHRYGIHIGTVGKIVTRKSWRHI